jgi:hypothetical protein
LGAQDDSHPPDLLLLEESISGKLLGIYLSSQQDDDIISFSTDILQRYCETCTKIQELSDYLKKGERDKTILEANTRLILSYLTTRKTPMMRVIN